MLKRKRQDEDAEFCVELDGVHVMQTPKTSLHTQPVALNAVYVIVKGQPRWRQMESQKNIPCLLHEGVSMLWPTDISGQGLCPNGVMSTDGGNTPGDNGEYSNFCSCLLAKPSRYITA
ncbi:hypothetical protein CLAIMM_06714 [Cladophialophora immunda]|nr:hypothetical protein CLAIMM_06714 [Cladophialophora immunda]